MIFKARFWNDSIIYDMKHTSTKHVQQSYLSAMQDTHTPQHTQHTQKQSRSQRPENHFHCLSGVDVHFVCQKTMISTHPHSRLSLTGLTFLDNFSDSCIVHKLMCRQSQFQVIYHDKKHQRIKPGSLRHSSSHRDPARKIPVEGYPLIPVVEERADPINDDAWQL